MKKLSFVTVVVIALLTLSLISLKAQDNTGPKNEADQAFGEKKQEPCPHCNRPVKLAETKKITAKTPYGGLTLINKIKRSYFVDETGVDVNSEIEDVSGSKTWESKKYAQGTLLEAPYVSVKTKYGIYIFNFETRKLVNTRPFDSVEKFDNELALVKVKIKNNWGIYNLKTAEIIGTMEFNSVGPINLNPKPGQKRLSPAWKNDGWWGYIEVDETGYVWAIEPIYKYAFQFKDGFSSVITKEESKYRFIDENGSWIKPLNPNHPKEYDHALVLWNGETFGFVKNNRLKFFMNLKTREFTYR